MANATASVTMQTQLQSVEPLFIKDTDMPSQNIMHIAIVRAISRHVSPQAIDGVQRISKLWRIYLKTTPARLQLLAKKSIVLSGKLVPIYEQNPFNTNQTSPEDRKDKLTIRGLPVSLSNEEVTKMLVSKNIELASPVKFSYMRDEHGSLTFYRTGDRFVYCQPFDIPLPRRQKVGIFGCEVIHHGKDGLLCKSCNTAGHKVGDRVCEARAEENSIYGFSGYQHPLSNHYPAPIKAFDLEEPFKSIEHAFYWKMANEMDEQDLAEKIRKADHAGIVKNLSKKLPEEDRIEWEGDNIEIMKDILREKARVCDEFKECLIENQNKILAESTYNKKWGTGLNKWLTEATKPTFWPGTNLLGMLLMELTEEIIASDSPAQPAEDAMELVENAVLSRTVDVMTIEVTGTEDVMSAVEATPIVDTSSLLSAPEVSTSSMQAVPESSISSVDNNSEDSSGEDTDPDVENQHKPHNQQAANSKRRRRKGKKNNKDNTRSNNSKCNKSSNDEGKGEKTSRSMDIRAYMDPTTGKRKTLETTPEKQDYAKKHVT
jgi:ribA/ribD-fused uncharacterized protein